MNKFFEWMEEKGYGKKVLGTQDTDCEIYAYDDSIPEWTYVDATKQMLIGYMIEYLIENDIDWVSELHDEGYPYGIEYIHKHLDSKINEIE